MSPRPRKLILHEIIECANSFLCENQIGLGIFSDGKTIEHATPLRLLTPQVIVQIFTSIGIPGVPRQLFPKLF